MLIQYCISYLLTGLGLFVIALFSLLTKPASKVKRVFAYYSLAIAWWCLFSIPAITTHESDIAVVWCRTFIAGAILIPTLFIHFVLNFLYEDKAHIFHKKLIPTLYFITVLFLIANFSDHFIASAEPKQSLRNYSEPAILFHLHVVYFFLVSMFGVALLFRRLKETKNNASRRERLHLKYLCWTSLFGYIGGLPNYAMVYDIEIPFVNPFGTYLVGVYGVVMAYLIVRYRFLDIGLIVKKATVFASLLLALYGIFSVINTVGQGLLENILGWNTKVAVLPSFVIFILAFRPLEKWLINRTDKYLFQKKFDWKDFIHHFNREVLTQYDLDKIIHSTKEVIETSIRPYVFELYLVDAHSDEYVPQCESLTQTYTVESKIVEVLNKKKNVIWEEEHQYESPEATRKILPKEIVLVVPLIQQEGLLGFMFFGRKKSDELYTQNEIDMLMDLAIAEANAIIIARQTSERVKNQAAQFLGALADGLSHQYNNILSAIIRQLEMIGVQMEVDAEKNGKPEAYKIYQDRIEAAIGDAERGTEFAKSVLNHTRPGRVGFEVQDISQGIDVGVKLVYMKHRDFKTIKMEYDIQKDIPKTWSNMTSIQNMFQITIDNAYDAIHSMRESNPSHQGEIKVSIKHKKIENMIYIEIKDNGMGMKPNILKSVRAQVPHITTKGSTSDKSGFGAGVNFLGKLVAMHNGRLDYVSEYMNGTKAIIELPVIDRAQNKEETHEQTKDTVS